MDHVFANGNAGPHAGQAPALAGDQAGAPRSLIEQAYRDLRRDIVEGRYEPGERLRVEHLRDSYQVSGGTLREALALLVSDQLVVPQAQRGFRVAPMSLADLEDLTRTRTLLECAAVRDSIAAGDVEWEARVVSAFHKLSRAEEKLLEDAVSGFEEWEGCNRAFHEALTSASPSRWIRHFQSLLYQQAQRYRRLSSRSAELPASTAHDEHREIFAAAMARDADRAERVMVQHIGLALTVIKRQGILK